MKCASETCAIRASAGTSSGCGVRAVHRVAGAQHPAVRVLDRAAHGAIEPSAGTAAGRTQAGCRGIVHAHDDVRDVLGPDLGLVPLVRGERPGVISNANADPILIGISAAQDGHSRPVRPAVGPALRDADRADQQAGGVLGKQLKVQWIDTKSDKPHGRDERRGADRQRRGRDHRDVRLRLLVPGDQRGQGAARCRGIALCASSPKVATPAIVGPYGGSMGLGSDTEGSTMAEWIRKAKPQWKRPTSSRTRRSSTRRRRRTTSRPAGGSSAARSAARTRSSAARTSTSARRSPACAARSTGCDFIFDGSWQPYGLAADPRDPRRRHAKRRSRRTRRSTARSSTRWPERSSNFCRWASPACRRYCQGKQTPQVRRSLAVQGQVRPAARQPLRVARATHSPTRGRRGDQGGRLDRRPEDRDALFGGSGQGSTTSAA